MATIKQLSKQNGPEAADIVFIHGLTGDPIETWSWHHPDFPGTPPAFWPQDLAEDFDSATVWTIGYESSPTKWLGTNMPLLDRANSLLDLMNAHNIGFRPLVFVTHSLGGLLAKAIVRTSHDTPADQEKHELHKQTRGFVFFSTPHTGSSVANLVNSFPGSRATEIVSELSKNDAYLRDLSQWFSDKAKQLNYDCLTYFEAYKTKNITIVDATSANPNHGLRPVPFDGDHISICKIPDKGDQRYKQVSKFIRRVAMANKVVRSSEHQTLIDGVDIEIGVLPNPPEDGKVAEGHPRSRTLTYASRFRNNIFIVYPDMSYLREQAVGRIIDPVDYFWNPFRCQFPSLDITVVNNSSKTLVLTEATIEVASSRPDFSPVIVIPANTWGMKLIIKNEGWGKVSNAVLRCNLLPTDAVRYMPDPPISHITVGNEFRHEFNIGDFAETAEVDLRETLGTLGVDLATIDAAPKRSQIGFVMQANAQGRDAKLAQHMGRFPDTESDAAWAPFPDGYVVVAGRLDFDSLDQIGNETHYTLPLRARVFMFNVRYDQPMPPSYNYNAELEHTGTDYEVPVKLSQSLKPGEADRFTIRLACTQSAIHDFKIRWRFAGGLSCNSSQMILQHFVPRTFAGERVEFVQNTSFETEDAEAGYNSSGSCVEESLRMILSLQSNIRAANPPRTGDPDRKNK